MPIVDVEVVTRSNENIDPKLASAVADAAGEVFGTEPGRTWVRLRTLSQFAYAENGGGSEADVLPVFVTVLKADVPDRESMRQEVQTLAARFAPLCNRPAENVHILYEPAARGRIAFGGKLVE